METIGLYPVWLDPNLGSGWVIGVIATVHVLFSHTSVGGAIFFAWLAHHAYRHNKPELLSFIKRYGMFLLVFSYVLGSITGPGIWYSTTVGSPRGISSLIHNFVWWWATEWVFFVTELVGIYLLVYLVGKVDLRTHTRLAWIFGLASYATMMIIVGILSFMMWPGKAEWATEGSSLAAFFGANTFAHLAMRTAFMMTITAVVGGIMAAGLKDAELKRFILRRLAVVGSTGAIIGSLLLQWYLNTLPETAFVILENRLPSTFLPAMIAAVGIAVLYFLYTAAQPHRLTPAVAAVMTVVITVAGLWPEEVARESLRKPYVAGQFVYSNQVVGQDVPALGIRSELPKIEAHGFLKTLAFLPENLRTITDENRVEVGRVLALNACANCHSLTSSGIRPLQRYFAGRFDEAQVADYLRAALSTGYTLYMPEIPLKDDEARALAAYLVRTQTPTVHRAEQTPTVTVAIRQE